MKLFDNVHDLAATIGLKIREQTPHGPSFAFEADWGYRLRGQGQPGGLRGGWLVTRAQQSDWSADGHLIAYEIDAEDSRTGRCALLRSPWPQDVDSSELARVLSSGWWTPQGREGEMDIDVLDGILSGTRL